MPPARSRPARARCSAAARRCSANRRSLISRICASSARNRCSMAAGSISRRSRPRSAMSTAPPCVRCCASAWAAACAISGPICGDAEKLSPNRKNSRVTVRGNRRARDMTEANRSWLELELEDDLDEELEQTVDDARIPPELREVLKQHEKSSLDRHIYFTELLRLQGE